MAKISELKPTDYEDRIRIGKNLVEFYVRTTQEMMEGMPFPDTPDGSYSFDRLRRRLDGISRKLSIVMFAESCTNKKKRRKKKD